MGRMGRTTGMAAALALTTLAGCSAVYVDDLSPPRHNYHDGDYEYAVHKGAIVTQIVGNPFGIPEDAFRNAVMDRMQGHTRTNLHGRFVAAPTDQTIAPFKVVAAFNMPSNIDGHVLCKGPSALPPPMIVTGQMTLDMAFCFGDGLKTEARGRVAGVSGMEDPKFTSLVRRVTEAMIPARDGMSTFEGGGSVP